MDFNKYEENPHDYRSPSQLLRKRQQEIDQQKLTTAAREKALKEAKKQVYDEARRLNEPHRQREAENRALFWTDCRAELGYDQFLDETAVSALEHYAWQAGHASGFREVYYQLSELVPLARDLVRGGDPTRVPAID